MPEKFLPFLLFMFVGSITPGPNTMISTASGAAFGFTRTLPQMLGVSMGFPLMIAGLGFGLGEIFRQQPWLHEILRYMSARHSCCISPGGSRARRVRNAPKRNAR